MRQLDGITDLLDSRVNERENRDANQHTERTHDIAHEHDGNDNPDGIKPDDLTDDGGIDDISFNLLKNQNDDDKDKHHGDAVGEHDDGAGNCTDEGTEVGNDIGDGNQHADERVVMHLSCHEVNDPQNKEGDDAEHERVKDLRDEEAAEGAVGDFCCFEQTVI